MKRFFKWLSIKEQSGELAKKSLQEMFDFDKLRLAFYMYQENNDNAKALWVLHYYYENGWCGIKINQINFIVCLKNAAEQGHAGATYKLIQFLSNSDEHNSIELIRKYTSAEHVKKCYEKINEFNDGQYYSQEEYINLLEKFIEQTKHTKGPCNCTLRYRNTKGLQPSL